MAISFEAIGERMVTFAAGTGLKEGKVCKMTANGTVGACGENDSFIGVVSSVRGGAANVVMGGYVEVSYAGTTTPALGYDGQNVPRCERRCGKQENRSVFIRGKENYDGF